jgi:hypothetical protein
MFLCSVEDLIDDNNANVNSMFGEHSNLIVSDELNMLSAGVPNVFSCVGFDFCDFDFFEESRFDRIRRSVSKRKQVADVASRSNCAFEFVKSIALVVRLFGLMNPHT